VRKESRKNKLSTGSFNGKNMKGMKYGKEGRNRELPIGKNKVRKRKEADSWLRRTSSADRRLCCRFTTLDKFCEAFVQGTPDAKLVIDLMRGVLENIIKNFSVFTNPNGTRDKWLKIINWKGKRLIKAALGGVLPLTSGGVPEYSTSTSA
jgi:hypothetical protein